MDSLQMKLTRDLYKNNFNKQCKSTLKNILKHISARFVFPKKYVIHKIKKNLQHNEV